MSLDIKKHKTHFIILFVVGITIAYAMNTIDPLHFVPILVALVIIPVLFTLPIWKTWCLWPICYALLPLFLIPIVFDMPFKVNGIRTFYIPFALLVIIINISFFLQKCTSLKQIGSQNKFIVDKVALAFLIILLISLLAVGVDLKKGLIYWAAWAFYIILIYHILLNSLNSRAKIKTLLTIHIFSVALTGIYGTINYLCLGFPGNIIIGRSGGTETTLLNLNESAWVALVTLPISMCSALSSSFPKKIRTSFFIASFVILTHLLLSDARWAWFSILFAFTAFLLLLFPISRHVRLKAKLAKYILIVMIIGFGFYFFVPAFHYAMRSVFSSMLNYFSGGIMTGEVDHPRAVLLEASKEIIKEHWLLGTGVGNYWAYFPTYLVTSDITEATPHCFYLRIIAEAGLGGLIIFLLFLFSAGKTLFKALRNEKDESWRLILYGFATSFVTLGIYEVGMESVFSPFFWFFMGLLVATEQPPYKA